MNTSPSKDIDKSKITKEEFKQWGFSKFILFSSILKNNFWCYSDIYIFKFILLVNPCQLHGIIGVLINLLRCFYPVSPFQHGLNKSGVLSYFLVYFHQLHMGRTGV